MLRVRQRRLEAQLRRGRRGGQLGWHGKHGRMSRRFRLYRFARLHSSHDVLLCRAWMRCVSFCEPQVTTVVHLDRPMYLLGYLAAQNRVFLIDK